MLAVLVVAMLAGLALRLGGGDGEGEHLRRSPSRVIMRGALSVTVPAGWSRTDRAPRLPGMTFSRPILLINARSGVRVVAGALPATSRTLLPAPFVHGLQTDLPTPSAVRIGERLEAYHYPGVVHPGVGRLLDVYVAPTTAGVATVACLAEALGSLLDDCWSVVSSLSISGGRPLAPGGNAAFAQALRVSAAVLDDADARARRRLSDATTPGAQARAVAHIPAAYRTAAASLAPLADTSSARSHAVLGALRRTGTAYAGFERSLREADADAYARARRALRARRASLRRLLDRVFASTLARVSR